MIKRADNWWSWLAWHMPRRLAYWCAVRVFVHATGEEWSSEEVPEVTCLEAMRRWDK
jgi:hypothetical protein